MPPIYIGVCLARVLGLGLELAQARYTLVGAPEIARAPAIVHRASVLLRPQLGLSWLFCNEWGKGRLPWLISILTQVVVPTF